MREHIKLYQEVLAIKNKRKVEVFSAGCSVCDEVIELVNRIACPDCDVIVLDMKDSELGESLFYYTYSSV